MQLIGKCALLTRQSFVRMCNGNEVTVVAPNVDKVHSVPGLSSDVSFQFICAQILMREFSVAAVHTLTMFMAKKDFWGQTPWFTDVCSLGKKSDVALQKPHHRCLTILHTVTLSIV